MKTTRTLARLLAICGFGLTLLAGCGGDGGGDGDGGADVATDAPADVPVDVPEDGGADVPPDVTPLPDVPDVADVPEDSGADGPPDVAEDSVDAGPPCPTECCAPADCDDGVDCTLDECGAEGACTHTTVVCDDEDECTADRCSAAAECVHEPVAGCCPFEPLAEVPGAVLDFEEAGLAGWTVEDRAQNTRPAEDPWDQPILWQVDGERAYGGDGALYFGSPTRRSYDNGRRVAAAALSPALALPADTAPELQLRVWLDAEEGVGYDALTITAIVPDGGDGPLRVPVWTKPDGFPLRSWARVRVELAAFAGRTVQVELLFDSVDGSTNDFEGAYVDDVTLGTRCARPACAADADCDDGVACTSDGCADDACAWELPGACCLTGMDCDDGDACSVDRCLEGTCNNVVVPTEGCCNADADCDDGDTCTSDRCVDNVCEPTPSGATGCCTADADCADDVACTETSCHTATGACQVAWTCECRYDASCDDGDDRCTEDRCLDGVCLNRATAADGCCVSEVFVDRFESPAESGARWVFESTAGTVGWTFWDGQASSSSALYFGNPASGNYQTGARVAGTATTAPILLPAGVPATLSFDLYLAIESGTSHDTFRFALVHEGGELTLFLKDFQTETYTWHHVTADLSGFAGHEVRLRFYFDSQDGEGNDGEGVFVDEFALTSSCRARECGAVIDCFDGFGATADLCVGGLCQYRVQESLCDGDAQCNDGAVCTRDRCVLGGCVFEPIAGCCASSIECDDRNVCTTDTCEGSNPPLCQHRRIASCCVTDRDCDDGNACTDDVCPAEGLFCDNVPREDCCLLNVQCADDEPCTRDRCVANACQNTWTCCEADAECDDQDECTVDACVDGTCVFDVDTDVAGCCESARVVADFEGGTAPGFEFSGGSASDAWRVVEPGGGAHSGAYALYYGNSGGTAYGNNSYGEALSPYIPLPAGQEMELSFWIRIESEAGWDYLTAYLVVGGQSFEIDSWSGSLGWTEVTYDVSYLAGGTARLRFEFDSDGSSTNTGAWVDDVAVHSTCARPPCSDDGDCEVPVACVESRCLGGGCLFEEQSDCCAAAADCDDLDPCTTDSCVAGACQFAAVAGCCRAAEDCAGESECLIGACVANRCRLACDPACEECCLARSECDDGQACTVDDCVDNTCTHADVCCASDEECDDGDDVCTTDACVDSFCRFLIDPTIPGCCEEATVLAGFEDGSLGGFVVSSNAAGGDAWYVAAGAAHSGTLALHYGGPNNTNYHDFSQGTARSPSYFVPAGQELTLSLWLKRQTESSFDYVRAYVETPFRTWPLGSWSGTADWHEVTFDVTFLAGQTFQLRFEFTSDGSSNYGGVWVDDIALRSTCAPRPCDDDADCTAPTGCVEARCLGGSCDFQPRTDCCASAAQCDDRDPCTTDACTNDVCVHQDVPGCCVLDAHCEDGNACTRDACVSLRCQKTCDPACPDCCLSANDCVDQDDCTRDRCVAYECVHQPLCCTTDEECDDGDDVCTTERCVDGRCEITTDSLNPACCEPQPVVFDFEDGSPQDFAFSGSGAGNDRWQVVGSAAHTGSYSLWFGGDGGAYHNYSDGQALSPPIALPANQALTLSFWFRRDMESCCDYFEVFVEAFGESVRLGTWNGDADWTEVRFDASQAAGQTVRLRFTFDSDVSSTGLGVWVDDIVVTSACAPVACERDGDCPEPAGCIDWTCVDGGCRSLEAQDCCSSAADCNDGSNCTIDACTDQRCSNILDPNRPGCCTVDAHCDDGNECTPDVCGGALCLRACAPECPYGFPWQDDFTTAPDLAGSCWTAAEGSGWAFEAADAGGNAPRLRFAGAAEPEGAWEDCVVSPTVDTHRAYDAALSFWHRATPNDAVDTTMSVRLTRDGGLEWHEVWSREAAEGNAANTQTVQVLNLVDAQEAVQLAFCVGGSGPQPLIWTIDEVGLLGEAFVGERPEWTVVPETWDVAIGEVATVAVLASDGDDDPLTLNLAEGAPPFVTLTDHGDGSATLTAAPGIGTAGESVFFVLVNDTWTTVPAPIALTVTIPGVPPVVDPVDPLRVVPETVRNVPLRATDADGQPLAWTIAAAPDFVTLRDAGDGTGLLTATPHIADVGEYLVDLLLSDTTQLVPLTIPLVVAAPGDVAPILEDFEAAATLADAGWETASDAPSVMNDWALAPVDGDQAAQFLDFPIVTGFEDRLLSPVFDAAGLASVAVRWTGAFRDYPFETADPKVSIEVLASADGGETWTSVWSRYETDGDLPRGPFEADATGVLAGSATARIAFRIAGGSSAALLSWEVDDVIVWGTLAP